MAPIGAIKKLIKKTGWSLGDVDLFEVNEAFAVVGMAAMTHLEIPHDKLNVHGGACALGHPIGASGARILVTLLSALRQRKPQTRHRRDLHRRRRSHGHGRGMPVLNTPSLWSELAREGVVSDNIV